MSDIPISLPEADFRYAEAAAQAGSYSSVAEYVLGLIRAQQESVSARRERMAAYLQTVEQELEQRGPSSMTVEQIIAQESGAAGGSERLLFSARS